MIGDVLVSSTICNNLRKAYPDSQIDYLVYESTIPVLEGNPNIDNVSVTVALNGRAYEHCYRYNSNKIFIYYF